MNPETEIERRFRERGTEIEKRLTELESQAKVIRFIGAALTIAVIGLAVNAFGHVLGL